MPWSREKLFLSALIFAFLAAAGGARANEDASAKLHELTQLLKKLLEEAGAKEPSDNNPWPQNRTSSSGYASSETDQAKYEIAIADHLSNAPLDKERSQSESSARNLMKVAEERLRARGYRLGPIQVDPGGRSGFGFEVLSMGKDPIGKVLEKSQKRFGFKLIVGVFSDATLGGYQKLKKTLSLHPVAFSHRDGAVSGIALHEIRHAYFSHKIEGGKPSPLSTVAYATGDAPVSSLPGYEKIISYEEISTNYRNLKQLSELPVSKAELLGITQLEQIYNSASNVAAAAESIKKLSEAGLKVLERNQADDAFFPRDYSSPVFMLSLPADQGTPSPGKLLLYLDKKYADTPLAVARVAAMDSLRASIVEAERIRKLAAEHLDKIVERVEASRKGSFSRPRAGAKDSILENKTGKKAGDFRAAEEINAQALKRQVDFELNYNQAAPGRSSKPIRLRHLEIPLKQLDFDATDLSPALKSALVFTRGEEQYYRWILNPEDATYGAKLKQSLKQAGVPYRELEYFNGYLSASRSVFVTDPVTGTVMSIKASTDKTGGLWKDKQETVRAARAGRLISDHIRERSKVTENKHFRYLGEPVATSFSPADQAVIVREHPHLNAPNLSTRLIPFFSIIQSELGEKIAKENGASTPEKILAYWSKHLFEPWGKSAAEAALNFGIFSNSAHSQNYLLEVEDRGGRLQPTGKIYARDLSDGGLIEPLVKRGTIGEKLISLYETMDGRQNPILGDNAEINYSPFVGDRGRSQSWISADAMEKWRDDFIGGFESRFRELAGFEIELVLKRRFFHELRGHTKMVIADGITDNQFKALEKRIAPSVVATQSLCSEKFAKFTTALKQVEEPKKPQANSSFVENIDGPIRAKRRIIRRPGVL